MRIVSYKSIKQKLKFITDEEPGYSRRKYGRGFAYYDEKGKHIKNEKVKKRINSLAIPPAWKEVWICPHPQGYLQVTGRDQEERKQYIYHDLWLQYRQQTKFFKMLSFGEKLPATRKKLQKYLDQKEWTREKVLALMITLLDNHGFRIGNQNYYRQHGTVGLTTLRRKHIDIEKNRVSIEYTGKSRIDRVVDIEDPELIKLIQECHDRPGYELFRYKDEKGQWQNVKSEDVNEMIHELMGDEFSSKDFRTWKATVFALELSCQVKELLKQEDKPRKFDVVLVERVAEAIGNTPAVCRDYYIHPGILEEIGSVDFKYQTNAGSNGTLRPAEKRILKLLKKLDPKKKQAKVPS